MAADGNDLLRWFRKKPGPWISEQIEAIEKAVVNGEVENEKEAIRAWMQKRTF
ncbi:MAG TPA: hypothetical protein VFJ73_03335 [Bacillales bacterium]|nr:hypothetical protein [Bacillales bacterium]